MSAQIIQFRPSINPYPHGERPDGEGRADDSQETPSHVPFEVFYQALFARDLKPEDLAREQYLLDCD